MTRPAFLQSNRHSPARIATATLAYLVLVYGGILAAGWLFPPTRDEIPFFATAAAFLLLAIAISVYHARTYHAIQREVTGGDLAAECSRFALHAARSGFVLVAATNEFMSFRPTHMAAAVPAYIIGSIMLVRRADGFVVLGPRRVVESFQASVRVDSGHVGLAGGDVRAAARVRSPLSSLQR